MINLISSLDNNWWNFIVTNEKVNIFHHPNWIELFAECYGFKPVILTITDPKGEIRAGLPILEVNSLFTGRRWISLPFTDHCAPLYQEKQNLKKLTDEMVSLSKDPRNPIIELRENYPNHENIHTYNNHVLHTLNLEPDPEAVFKNFHSMHKRNIKKAQKNGIFIEIDTKQKQLEQFYRLHLHNRRSKGLPVQPKVFFRHLQKKLLDQGLGFILSAYLGSRCIAAYIFLHWGDTLTYKYGASDHNFLDSRPNNLLMWEGIRWGCENGYQFLDMGRTSLSNTGLREFKSKWGAKETPLTYCRISRTKEATPNHYFERLMNTIIQKSPAFVCRATGELLYKHFA